MKSTLWKAMYDEVLSLEPPKWVEIALTVLGEMQEKVKMLATEDIGLVEDWMEGIKLKMAHHKTDVILFSNRKAVIYGEITVGRHAIASQRKLKHLVVMLDDRLNFNSHVDYACEKAAKSNNALTRLTPNIGGPRSSKGRLLAGVSTTLLRYGAPAWGVNKDKLKTSMSLAIAHNFMAHNSLMNVRIL